MKIDIGDFNNCDFDKMLPVERILYEFKIKEADLKGIDTLAIAGEFGDYEEWLVCIFRKNNRFYMFEASHCS